MRMNQPAGGTAKKPRGPRVRLGDESIDIGQRSDVDSLLAEFERLDADARGAFLCIVAHDLTVAIRSVVYDPPITEEGLDRAKWINEALHQLTSCVNPHHRWSAHDEAELIRGIIEDSFQHGFDGWVGRAITAAASDTIDTKKSVAAR